MEELLLELSGIFRFFGILRANNILVRIVTVNAIVAVIAFF